MAYNKSALCRTASPAFSFVLRKLSIKTKEILFIRKKIAGFDWNTVIAAVSMFWNTNVATVTSCESALLCFRVAPRDLNWENKIKK